MRRRLHAVSIVAILALGSLLAGLAPAVAIQGSAPQILRKPWSTEFIYTLEPQTNQAGISDLTLLNYEGLTRFDEEQNVVPGAAESWDFDEAGTTITFHLHDKLTYSDGSPLTAERFRYAIERRCDPHLEGWGADRLFDIVGCEELHAIALNEDGSPQDAAAYEAAKAQLGVRARDQRTLEIELLHPAPYFPALTQFVDAIPVKEELVEAGAGEEMWLDAANWVGNGPFQVTAIEPDAQPPHIMLKANERYWGGRPKLDGIEYLIMSYEEAFAAYQRGELDIIDPLEDRLPELEADPVLSRELVRTSQPFIDIYNFNLTRDPFTDKHVREAFSYAFDRESYCRQIIRGLCTPVLSWIPAWVPGAVDTDAYAFDPAKARDALAQSSYGGPEALPEIVWYYGENDDWELRRATWLADQFRQILGVELTLTPVSWDEIDAMQASAETWPQIANTYWWSGLPDPHGWLGFWTCGSEQFATNVGYCNAEYDALVARSDQEMDPATRISLAEEAQRLMLADAAAIFGFRWDRVFLVKPYVTGYSPTAPNQAFPGWWTPLTLDLERPT
jgi:oligopeptide transport system substrate-binding protein